MSDNHTRHIHFIGVSGIGMSGLARICLHRGMRVSGCDCRLNKLTDELQRGGAIIAEGHNAEHIQSGIDLVVYSSAVPADTPELLRAKRLGIPIMSRGRFLAELAKGYRLVSVAGAHGKTTTSAMASQLLLAAQWEPTVVVGGTMLSLNTNACAGTGNYMVVEADESDGSFLHLQPEIAIVTNIDREHMNYYQHFERLIGAFQHHVEKVETGTVILCADDPLVREHLSHPRMRTYGIAQEADVMARDIVLLANGCRFRAAFRGRDLGRFSLQIPGRHNVLNALAIITLGLELEIPMTTVRDCLQAYLGTQRRFQMQRLPGDIQVVEDYAHHPNEIRATLAAGAQTTRHRLAVFQPHRFSRTQSLEAEFAGCFDSADGVIVTDIYGAMETPIPGVSGERLAAVIGAGGHPCVRYVPKNELQAYLAKIAQSGDTIFFLGAGDIGELCHAMASQLHSSERTAS